METLAYLYFTESYEDSDPASLKPQSNREQQSNAAELSNTPTSTPGDQSVSMQPTGYDPKLEAQPNWMML